MSQSLLKNFTDEPIILQVDGDKGGALYLDKESKLRVTLESSDFVGSHKKMPDYYTGAFSGAYVKIVKPRTTSSKTWWGKDRQVSQISLHYQYVLVTGGHEALAGNKATNFQFDFPALFDNPTQPDEVMVKNKTLEITIKTDIAKNVTTVYVKPKKAMTIDEVIQHRTRLERFFTSFINKPVKSKTTTLVIKKTAVSYIDHSRPVHSPDVDIEEKSIQAIKVVAELLLKYVTNFKDIGYATHLHASYVEYGSKEIYLESRLSVLFAGVDSLYSKLTPPPSKNELVRISEYESFILDAEKLEDTKGNKNLLKFLKKESTKLAYTSPVSFQAKLNAVYDFTSCDRLSPAISGRMNTLRNNIAHGNDYDFDEFITEWTDARTGTVYPAITFKDIEGVSSTLWTAIKRLATQ